LATTQRRMLSDELKKGRLGIETRVSLRLLRSRCRS